MADDKNTQNFTREMVRDAEGLLQRLKDEARKAHQESNVFMLDLYTELVRVTSPIVTNALERIEREEKAAINRACKGLRKSLRDGKKLSASQQAANA